MTRFAITSLTLITAFASTACFIESGDPQSQGEGGSGAGGGSVTTASLEVTLESVEPLGQAFTYEGWIIVDGSALSTGRFDVDPDQSVYTFDVDAADAEIATAFVLTIEPVEDDPVTPSDVHYLAGDILNDQTAELGVGHPAALGTDFGQAAATFILETPTSHDVEEDYDQGIWWLEMTASGPAASLELPELPTGWVYEGWVVQEGIPISTGRFTSPSGADDDGAGPDAGPDMSPPFPGQDFVDPALVLTDLVAVISVEPMDDDSPAPFAIKPLVDASIEALGAGTSQAMENASGGLPRGSLVIR